MKLHRILLLTLCAYGLISCGGAEERKTVYLEKAKAFFVAGNLEKARIEIKNVLQIDPKYAEGYLQLGKIYEEKREYRAAFSNYLKAEDLNPDLLENQARLGRVYLLLANEPDKAQEKIDYILSKEPGNVDGLLLKATMMVKNENTSDAIAICKKVIANEPGHTTGSVLLASLYTNNGEHEKATHVLEVSKKLNPGSLKLNKLLALVYVKDKRFNQAEIIYKDFLTKYPDNKSSYDNLAAFYNQIDNKSKAEEMLRASVENDPGAVDRQATLVKFIAATKGKDQAITELKKLIDRNSGLGELRTRLAEMQFINGDKQSAIETYKQAIAEFSEEITGINARIALTNIYVNEAENENAKKIIDEAFLISPNDPNVNLLRGRFAVRDKDFETAIISLQIVTKETPENIDAFLILAKVYQIEGNDERSREILNSAYENNRTNAASLLKLAKYYVSHDMQQAEKIIGDYNKIKENDYEGLSIKAAIYNKRKNHVKAKDIAASLVELFPGKPNGYMQAVPYYSKENQKKKVISILEKGYLNVEDNRKILILLTSFQTMEKQYDIVKKRIKAELKSTPDDIELKLLLAKVHLADNENDKGIKLINEVINERPEIEDSYLLLAQTFLAKKDDVALREALVKGAKNAVRSIKIHLKLAAVYEADGSYLSAIETYREINKKNPDNLLIANNLASLLSDYGNDKDDLKLAKQLIVKLEESNHPVFLDTIGWVYYKLGDYLKAVELLSKVVNGEPEINIFNYHLGMAHKMAGNKAEAKVYLEKSTAGNKAFKQRDLAEAALKDL